MDGSIVVVFVAILGVFSSCVAHVPSVFDLFEFFGDAFVGRVVCVDCSVWRLWFSPIRASRFLFSLSC